MPRKRHIATPEPAAPPAANEGRCYTVVEVAQRWRASRHTVMVAIRSGRLQAFRVGHRQYRIREDEVVRYEQQQIGAAS